MYWQIVSTHDEVELLAEAAVAVRNLDGVQVLPEVTRAAGDLEAASVTSLYK